MCARRAAVLTLATAAQRVTMMRKFKSGEYRLYSRRSTGVPAIHGIARKCSCISGVPAVHGHRRKMLLHFRRTGRPWP